MYTAKIINVESFMSCNTWSRENFKLFRDKEKIIFNGQPKKKPYP